MAGAGYKLFATGDVLTAAQVNTYLMQQTVMVFASSAARTTALSGVLAEGMVSYLQDSNTLEVYDGSAWVGATGDITGLTAGTGISISSATGPVPTVAIDTAVTADLTTGQTLTNKTLTSPVLTTPSISNINAKGDILVGTADNTLGVITAGANGETIVADSSTSTGLRYTANFAAGKNKIVNGDFGIWQRGTSFTGASGYTSDRWSVAGGESGSVVSRQTFTPGTAPVAGYEGTYFLDFAKNGTTANSMFLEQKMEDVRLFAGQTITISFWMKGSTAFTNEPLFRQNFGSGGSSEVYTTTATNSVTTSWARYSVTVAVPSISGKTIGTSSFLGIWPIRYTGTSNITVSIWGVQVEAGSVATAFQTATGTLQGELAACQRYFQTITGGTTTGINSTSSVAFNAVFPPMRTSSITFALTGAVGITDVYTADYTQSSANITTNLNNGVNGAILSFGNFSGLTAYRNYSFRGNVNITASAEL